jgi:2',3'-cyclic-nucleotide 2'-phosphodiesterase (5'-nucleotidase family)
MLIVRAMNAMGYDALALGPMDVAPLPLMQARFQEADFAILSANVGTEGVLPNVQPYLIEEIGGHTVAIIGATNERIGQQGFQESGLSLSVESAVVAVRRAVQEVTKQANVVVVLSNLGGRANETLAQEIPGIDAIIGAFGGRQNKEVAGPEGLVVLRAAGTRGEWLGVLTPRFDDGGRVAAFDAWQVALTPDYADDPDIARMIRELTAGP